MHTDKELAQPLADESQEVTEDSGTDSLSWLLDLESNEPEEKVFKVELDDYVDQGLSAFEAEVASRPMFRGKAGADELSTYVNEEIIISSESARSDIYNTPLDEEQSAPAASQHTAEECMAVDYSAGGSRGLAGEESGLEDGVDILGELDDQPTASADPAEPVQQQEQEPVQAEEATGAMALSDAPVPGTVATPASLSVANEVAAESEAAAVEPAAMESAAVEPADEQPLEAIDYVAAYSPEADDEAFDQYLLEGEALAGSEPDMDAFTLEPMEGGLFEDGAGEPGFDFHEDLDGLAGFDSEPVADLAAAEVSIGDIAAEAPIDEALVAQGPTAGEIESIFEDDLFAGDPTDGELVAAGGEPADIDAFFDDIAAVDESDDAIGGVELAALEPAEGMEDPAVEAAAEEVVATKVVATKVAAQEVAAEDERQEDVAQTEEPEAPAEPEPIVQPQSGEGDFAWCIPEGITFNYTSASGAEIFADFLEAFLEEGSVELEKLEDAISAWEEDIASEQAFTVVTRTLHTIKGIAKGVGLQYYGTLIHNFETLLEAMPKPAEGAEQDYFRIVNGWLDAAVRGLEHVRESRQDVASEFPGQAGAATGSKQPETVQEQAVAEPVQEATAPAAPKDKARKQRDRKLADEGARTLGAQQSVRITPEKLDHLLNLANQTQQLGVRTARSTSAGKRTSAELQARLQSVRSQLAAVSDRRLFEIRSSGKSNDNGEMDALEMDQYSELQETASILREGIEDLAELAELAARHNSQIEALLKQQSAVVSSLGSSIRAARVIPASRLMPGLRRLVRTVSNDLGKNVSFSVLNEVGTLDRDDYARCQIVLEHMVRNALDHGIESPTERHEGGKPAAGRITVDVRQAGANALITLADDGRGIDPQAMRESARRKGLDVDVDALSDEEALRLVFHKGFSTASSVSEISGRGVGMDIVLSELQQMGGEIRIESTLGQGTAFHIRIPSNVTVNGALLVSAGDSSYAIPLGGLVAVEHVPVDDFFAAVEQGRKLELSGIYCEPTYLAKLCQYDTLPEKKTWNGSVPVIVAGSEERYMAIAIDHVEEALELVIRSLGSQFSGVPGVAGAATTADGHAVVALDLNLLVESVPDRDQHSLCIEQDSDDPLLVLVVDDSRTQRMVTTSQLENLGVETLTAENGGVAIDLLNSAEQLPDIVLLDVEMPVKDGIQTLREIRKSVRYSHIPVIMVTSRTGLKHRTLAEQAGCNGYMGKPFNFPMLVGQISELTGHPLQID